MKKIEDEYYSYDYKKTCDKCRKTHTLYTKKDDCPEYYTDVYLKCDCGEFINFNLPVN